MSPVEIGGWQDHSGQLHDGAPENPSDAYAVRAYIDTPEGDRWFTALEPFPDDLYEYDSWADWLETWFAENYGEFA